MRPQSPTPRLPDWPERLSDLVEARRNAPFAWGSHDCCLFAADAVLACTGQDPAADLRGAYATEAEAEAMLADAGGLLALLGRIHDQRGAGAIPPALAQRGDTVLIPVGNDLAVGVVLGADVAVPGPDGLVFLPLADARRCWVT